MKINQLVQHKLALYLTLLCIALLLYFPSGNGKFIGDLFYYIDGIERMGFTGFLTSFGIIHQNQVPCFFIYILYSIFKFNWVGWYVFYVAVHALNAYLIIRIVYKHLPKYTWAALFAGLMFLISPFQAEAVVWGACLHYLLCLTFLLFALNCIRIYYEQQNPKWIIFFGLSYLGALLCYEQAYVFPGVFFFYYLVLIQEKFDFKQLLRFGLIFLTLSLALIGFHLVLNVITYDQVIGHYGADTHTSYSLIQSITTFKNYLFKFLFFYRYIPDFAQPIAADIFNNKIVRFLLPSIYAAIIFIFWKKRKDNSVYRFGLFALISFVVVVSVVLNLDVSFNYVALSDRYGYSASAFFYVSFAIFLFSISKKIAPFIIGIYLLAMIPATVIEAKEWGNTGKFAKESIFSFPQLPEDAHYFTVNLTDDYNGHICLRDGFREAIDLYQGFQIKRENLTRIADVNVFSFHDETKVEKLDELTYKVTSTEFGKWYRNHGKGMVNHEHEYYTCEVDEWNLSYIVTFKAPVENGYLIKAVGSDWEIIDTLSAVAR